MTVICNLTHSPIPFCRYTTRFLVITPLDSLFDRTRKIGSRFCHWCNYCQPCSQGISIGAVLNIKSLAKRTPLKRVINRFGAKVEGARECTECGECVQRCPYDLPIPELLKENITFYEKLKDNYASQQK